MRMKDKYFTILWGKHVIIEKPRKARHTDYGCILMHEGEVTRPGQLEETR